MLSHGKPLVDQLEVIANYMHKYNIINPIAISLSEPEQLPCRERAVS